MGVGAGPGFGSFKFPVPSSGALFSNRFRELVEREKSVRSSTPSPLTINIAASAIITTIRIYSVLDAPDCRLKPPPLFKREQGTVARPLCNSLLKRKTYFTISPVFNPLPETMEQIEYFS